ncbi:VanZ family protein [Streptomyces herbicida]|uniref:VanZ family protein n=1 Tax=Streptomyces herbicida TaxID=3065675 RepID=UPI002931C2E4|nr:VanZ family protein [Streptomyces sp. NEAU-HV9]
MIRAIFSAQPLLAVLLVTSSSVLALAGFLLGHRINRPKRFSWALAGAGVGVALSATLTPAKGSSGYSGTCTISKDFLGSVGTEQWLLNVALFAPVGLFFALAGASYAGSVVVSSTLSMAIEFTQAALPGIGRACDSNDFVANTLGALLGAVCLIVISLLRNSPSRERANASGGGRGLLATGGVMGVVAIAGLFTTTMVFVDSSTPITEASSSQERSVSHTLEALSDRIHVTRTQISNLPNDYGAGQRTLVASWKNGNAEFSWPDAKIHQLWSSTGIPLKGYSNHTGIDNRTRAKTLAAKLVSGNFPWASAATEVSADPDPQFRGAWRVTYRQRRDGVIMPLHFAVTFSKDGRLMQLEAQDTRAPDRIPRARVSQADASKTAVSHAPRHSHLSATQLRLIKEGASWRTVWDFTYSRQGDTSNSYNPVSVLVDASTGELLHGNGPDAALGSSL